MSREAGKPITIVASMLLAGLLSVAMLGLGASAASAAPCAGGTTNWTGATSNDFGNEGNWSNGSPSAVCDAVISAALNTPVSLSGGPFTVDDLTLSAGRELDVEPGSTLNTTTTTNAGTIRLGKAGEPLISTLQASGAAPNAISNSGTIVSAGQSGNAINIVLGNVTNTGTFQVEVELDYNAVTGTPVTFTNQGTISMGAGCPAVCFYSKNTFAVDTVVNGAGGSITSSSGSNYLLVYDGNFTQGAGSTSTGGAQSPVQLRGNLTMTGVGSTAELAIYNGNGVNASGKVGPGQTIKIPAGTLSVPSGTLTNEGTIRTVGAASLSGNITTTGPGLLDIAATTTHGGGTLDATGGNILVGAQLTTGTLANHGGQITGSGPIFGDVLNLSGIVNPALGVGQMTITGDYSQGAGGTLAIEAQGVVGPQHDLLNVGHNVDLGGTLRIVPELGFFSPGEGDALKVIDYSSARLGEFAGAAADPPFLTANPVFVGYDASDTSVFAFIGPGKATPTSPLGPPSLLNSPLYRAILESLQPNGSFAFTKKPVVFPGGKLGLEVDTSGSCRLTAVEKAVAGAGASASAAKKGKKARKGLIKKVTIYAYGSGAHIVPLNLTAKGKKLLKKKPKKGKASSSASTVTKDPLVITCTPVVYPVAGFTDGTQITGIGKAPTGNPPSGQPSIPSGPPTVQPGGTPTTKNPVVPLPKLPAQPPEPQEKQFKATVDLDATVGASVSFVSNGKTVRGFDASFRVVCGFPFPEAAPLETIHFDTIPATSIVGGGSTVIQGSFDIAQQSTGSPPTWITASLQGDNSNGYTVKVYKRRAGCEGGTIFNARKVP